VADGCPGEKNFSDAPADIERRLKEARQALGKQQKHEYKPPSEAERLEMADTTQIPESAKDAWLTREVCANLLNTKLANVNAMLSRAEKKVDEHGRVVYRAYDVRQVSDPIQAALAVRKSMGGR
jgi:hypothetical protein